MSQRTSQKAVAASLSISSTGPNRSPPTVSVFEPLRTNIGSMCAPVWNNIEPELIRTIASYRKARETAEFKETYRTRIKQLQAHYAAFLDSARTPSQAWMRELPNPAEAIRMPCMIALLKSDSPDAELEGLGG